MNSLQAKHLLSVAFVRLFTRTEAFFAVWFVIVAGFIFLMVRNYRKSTRRQFRGSGEEANSRLLTNRGRRSPPAVEQGAPPVSRVSTDKN